MANIIDIGSDKNNLLANRINLDTRIITIFDEIEEHTAKEIIDTLPFLDTVKGTILVQINSMGGCFYSTQAIVSGLLRCENEIEVDIIGVAFSGAAMIVLAGDYVRMSKLGSLMLHYPSWETDYQDLFKHVKDVASLKEHFERMMKTLLKETKLPFDKFKKSTKSEDFFITPAQCLKYNIVDELY